MKKKKHLIVFDIDDTLTLSESQHQSAYVDTMLDFGILDINQNWKEYPHHTDSHILKMNYERNFNREFSFSFIPAFERKMTERILTLKETEEIKGAKEFLDFIISGSDYAVCFATGSLLAPAFVKLSQAGLSFDDKLIASSNALYSREEIVKDAIKKAKSYYELDDFEEIISIGDGLWDLRTAKNLGLHFIGVGLKNYEDMKGEGVLVHTENWLGFDFNAALKKLNIDCEAIQNC